MGTSDERAAEHGEAGAQPAVRAILIGAAKDELGGDGVQVEPHAGPRGDWDWRHGLKKTARDGTSMRVAPATTHTHLWKSS